jgi:hypothetical protein
MSIVINILRLSGYSCKRLKQCHDDKDYVWHMKTWMYGKPHLMLLMKLSAAILFYFDFTDYLHRNATN